MSKVAELSVDSFRVIPTISFKGNLLVLYRSSSSRVKVFCCPYNTAFCCLGQFLLFAYGDMIHIVDCHLLRRNNFAVNDQ